MEYLRKRGRDRQDPFTPRQKEILYLAGNGLSPTEIAKNLEIAPGTLASHLKTIKATLIGRSPDISSQALSPTELYDLALQQNLLQPPSKTPNT